MDKKEIKIFVTDWLYAHKLLASLLILALLLAVWLWPIHVFNRSANEVESIYLFDGNTGKSADITDPAQIGSIVDSFRQVPLRRSFDLTCFVPRDGFNLSVSIKLKGSGEIRRFILNSDRSVKDVFFYYSYTNRFPFDELKSLCS